MAANQTFATISLKDTLAAMATGQPFAITFITAYKKQNTGGELRQYPSARQYLQATPRQQKRLKMQTQQSEIRKNPHHYHNSTRNIILPDGSLKKLHIRLIRQFNGKTVL